jgi:hypothetical protein
LDTGILADIWFANILSCTGIYFFIFFKVIFEEQKLLILKKIQCINLVMVLTLNMKYLSLTQCHKCLFLYFSSGSFIVWGPTFISMVRLCDSYIGAIYRPLSFIFSFLLLEIHFFWNTC